MGSFKTIGRPGIGGQKSSWKNYSHAETFKDINLSGSPSPFKVWADDDSGIISVSDFDPEFQEIYIKTAYFCLDMEEPDTGSEYRLETYFRRSGANYYKYGGWIDPAECNGRCCSRIPGTNGNAYTDVNRFLESIYVGLDFTTGSTPAADAEMGFIVMVSPPN